MIQTQSFLCGCDVKGSEFKGGKAFYNWALEGQRGVGWDDDWGFNGRHESDLTTPWLHEASAATAIVSLPFTPYLIKQPPVCIFLPLHGWWMCRYKLQHVFSNFKQTWSIVPWHSAFHILESTTIVVKIALLLDYFLPALWLCLNWSTYTIQI